MNIQKTLAVAAMALAAVTAPILPEQASAATDVAAISATEGAYSRDSFYVGGTMGGAFGFGATDWQGYGFSGTGAQAVANKGSSSVFEAGLLAGYQHRLESAPVMVGIEVDINYLGSRTNNDSLTYQQPAGAGPAPAGTYSMRSGRGTNYYGTVRGHLGYVIDEIMQVYVSGGFAYAGNSSPNENTVTYTDPLGGTRSFTGSGSDQSHTGSVFGAGFEYAFDTHLAARVEYEYISLKNSNITLTDPLSGGQVYIINDIKEKFSVARVGVVYSF